MKRLLLLLLLSLIYISNNKLPKYCDIKGNVNYPGVYEIKNNYTIQDIIKDAGGLKENSYTDNINLSKKVTDEMVIYINTKDEITKLKQLNNCDCSPKYVYVECIEEDVKKDLVNENSTTEKIIVTETTTEKIITSKSIITTTTLNKNDITEVLKDELININTCSLEDLITIKGLGEKKANKIIEYRENNGLFSSIEDILNVSGIGDATFNQIKDFIKI